MDVLLIGNDQTVEVTGVRDQVSGSYINNATVTARIKDSQGTDVEGETWPITLAYVVTTNGDYRGLFDDAIELCEGALYTIEIRVEAPGGLIAFYRFDGVAEYRKPESN